MAVGSRRHYYTISGDALPRATPATLQPRYDFKGCYSDEIMNQQIILPTDMIEFKCFCFMQYLLLQCFRFMHFFLYCLCFAIIFVLEMQYLKHQYSIDKVTPNIRTQNGTNIMCTKIYLTTMQFNYNVVLLLVIIQKRTKNITNM